MECKNCQSPLQETDKFCNHCGARVVDQQITYAYLASEMSERFFNIENNLVIRTIKDLTLKPALVIKGYINGVRKRHLQVANYLALAITISGLQIFLLKKFFQDSLDLSWMPFQENNPAFQDSTVLEATWEYQSIMYILFIPVIALIGRIVFFDSKKYSYLHHLVISTYTQAHLSICTFLPVIIMLMFGVNFFKLTYFFVFPVLIFYSAFTYKRLYELTIGQILIRTLLFFVVGGVIYLFVGVAMFLFWVVTGTVDLKEMIEAQRAAQEGVSYIASSIMNWTS